MRPLTRTLMVLGYIFIVFGALMAVISLGTGDFGSAGWSLVTAVLGVFIVVIAKETAEIEKLLDK